MKVLHVVTNTAGGAGAAATRQHLALLDKGIDSHIIALHNEKKLPNIHKYVDQKSNYRFSKKLASKLGLKNSWKYFNNVKIGRKIQCEVFSNPRTHLGFEENSFLESFDVINLHWVPGLVDYSRFFRKFKSKNICWTLHDLNPFSGFFHYNNDSIRNEEIKEYELEVTNYKRKMLSEADINYIVLNNWMKAQLLKSGVTTDSRIYKVYNSVNTKIFDYRSKQAAREKLNLSKDKIIVTFVSDYLHNYRKGMDLLYEVIESLDNKNIEVLAIGNSTAVDYKNVTSIGRIESEEELANYYAASDFFALPSREDNLPNVMVEALCVGCPVLSFNTGGMQEIINESNGYKSNEINTESFKKGFEYMIENKDRFLREKISKDAKEKFDPVNQVNSLLKVYEK